MTRRHTELLHLKEAEFLAKEEQYRAQLEADMNTKYQSREEELKAKEEAQSKYEEEQARNIKEREELLEKKEQELKAKEDEFYNSSKGSKPKTSR